VQTPSLDPIYSCAPDALNVVGRDGRAL
jgi:hypothetical protein